MSRVRACIAGTVVLAAVLAGCGGGGGSGADAAAPVVTPPPGTLSDTTAYSTAATASLAASNERAAVTTHSIVVAGATVPYTASAGHLDAIEPRSGATQASMFYVAYTVAAPAASRPLVFFFNGGPGSATIWLHLGSYAPRRVVTHAPADTVPLPFQLVDNAETLIDVADLVFVDAVGTGWSEAVDPFTNQSFWGVDSDAAVMRDFIARYVAVNGRAASPTFVLGESYGTTRAAVLADLMVAAGMRLDGVILQSSILDYNSNCDVFAPRQLSCEGFLPSYGETGAFHGLVAPPSTDADAYADVLRSFATTTYGPAAAIYVATRQSAPPGVVDQLVALTGAPAAAWNANLDLDASTFRSALRPGQLLGRYDARIAAPAASALAASGDPSSALISGPFAAAAQELFRNELDYDASAPYTSLSDAIDVWNFSHDGRGLPDTIPDLAAAFGRRPGLRVLSLAGYHDLATPFLQTEIDLARLGMQPTLFRHVYPGGHMTYLDDGSRLRLRTDIAAFIAGASSARAVEATRPSAPAARSIVPAPEPTHGARPGDGTAVPIALQRSKLAQGGDPWLPPALRVAPDAPSPRGAALEALVRRKIAARDRDVYR